MVCPQDADGGMASIYCISSRGQPRGGPPS